MSKLTEAFKKVGVFNPHGFYGDQPYISYRSQDTGRGGRGAAWQVHKRGEDLSSHWTDYGARTFSLFGHKGTTAEARAAALEEAKAWASERFGVRKWVKDAYRGWGPKAFVADRVRELKNAAEGPA